MFGFAVLVLLLVQRPSAADRAATRAPAAAPDEDSAAASPQQDRGLRVLLTPPIILSFCFFVLISVQGGLNSFLVVALSELYGTSDTIANVALTTLLLMNALGVLVGGVLASRTDHHAAVAGLGLVFAGIVTGLVAVVGHSSIVLVLMTSLSGLFIGVATPSRDMLVRAATPQGAFGRVFGFVSSGFNVGSMIAPMIYGMFLDHGEPRAVFLFSAACSILCIATVTFGLATRRRAEPALT
jgi:MFS family permease